MLETLFRGRLLVEIAAALTERGDRSKARDVANKGVAVIRTEVDRLVEKGDGHRACYLWVHLALLQNKMKDRLAARQSLDRAIEIARETEKENLRCDLMQFIAHAMAEIGDFANAQRKTELFTSRGRNNLALRDIGVAQARAGDLRGAMQTAEKMRLISIREKASARELYGSMKPAEFASRVALFAAMLRNNGHPCEKPDLVASVVAAWELARAEVLGEVALMQAKAGGPKRDEASKTIAQVFALVDVHVPLGPNLASMPLARIALAQAILGQAARAHATFVRSLKIARGLEMGLEDMARIAGLEWEAGYKDDAKQVLQEAFGLLKRYANAPQYVAIITQTQLKIGDLDGAIQTARVCRYPEGEVTLWPDVLRELVGAESAACGPSATVAEWYKITRSPLYRAYILLGAAESASPVHQRR